ncbi:CU044_2847 family protein [Streptomyces sp. S186]|uniref:CU044_2847 family protein n=1 Tax=Streptomyces sp. S186 TaxID=3434395 RepID=UPI003F66E155
MPDAIEFPLSDGTVVLVAPPARSGTGAVGLSDRLQAAQQGFREALAPVTTAAAEAIDGFRNLVHRPDEVEVSFGVILDGKLGGLIAGANAGAHLDVTLRWKGSAATPSADAEAQSPS